MLTSRRNATVITTLKRHLNAMASNSVSQPMDRAASDQDQNILGWLPGTNLVCAVCLLLIAFGDARSRAGLADAPWFFWTGLLGQLIPMIVRLLSKEASREERLGLVVLLGMGLYVIKVLHSPVAFTFPDEQVHLYNVNRLLATDRMFAYNPGLPVTSEYPGMLAVTGAIAMITGLPAFVSGVILIGIAKFILSVSLFLFFEKISNSARVAGIASVVYASNPNYIFFSSQFAYEQLAFPLAAAALLVFTYRSSRTYQSSRGHLTLLAAFIILSVVVTHHLTSYFMVGFLWLVTILYYLHPNFRVRPLRPAGLAVFSLLAVLLWFIFVAKTTGIYLYPIFHQAFNSMVQVTTGQGGQRVLFASSVGYTSPGWEHWIGIAAVLFLLLGAVVGQYFLYQTSRYRTLVIILSLAGVAYFPMLALRLTPLGWETSARSADFLFIGLAFIVASAIARVWLPGWNGRFTVGIFTAYLLVIFVGGFVVGWQPNVRLPKPYLVQDGSNLLQPESITAEEWMRANLGPGNIVAVDAENARTMLSYGEQDPLTGPPFGIQDMLFSTHLGGPERYILRHTQIGFVALDLKSTWDHMLGQYYYQNADQIFIPKEWNDPQVYLKFERNSAISKLFDSGNFVIYDVRVITNDTTQP